MDKKFQFLLSAKSPRLIAEAAALLDTTEAPGSVNNPVITGWATEVGGQVADVYKADSIPWCGLFMAVVAKRAGYSPPKSPLWALSWNTFGTQVEKQDAAFGDVLVFVRDGGGHVALYVGEDAGAYYCLGGNQGDRVCVTKISKKRLYGVRRCAWGVKQPKEVRKIFISAGMALSKNEA